MKKYRVATFAAEGKWTSGADATMLIGDWQAWVDGEGHWKVRGPDPDNEAHYGGGDIELTEAEDTEAGNSTARRKIRAERAKKAARAYIKSMTSKTHHSTMAKPETVKLKDRYSGGSVWLTVRDGKVVGAMGSDPKRFIGLSIDQAKHHARYGGTPLHLTVKSPAQLDRDIAESLARGERSHSKIRRSAELEAALQSYPSTIERLGGYGARVRGQSSGTLGQVVEGVLGETGYGGFQPMITTDDGTRVRVRLETIRAAPRGGRSHSRSAAQRRGPDAAAAPRSAVAQWRHPHAPRARCGASCVVGAPQVTARDDHHGVGQ